MIVPPFSSARVVKISPCEVRVTVPPGAMTVRPVPLMVPRCSKTRYHVK